MKSLESVIKCARRRAIFSPTSTSSRVSLGRDAIERLLPHRGAMLLVDRISAIDHTQEAMIGHRFIDPKDPVLAGHFPGDPVYPGALLLEAMGQVGLCLNHLLDSARIEVTDDDRPLPVRLLSVKEALFKAEVRPGVEIALVTRRITSGFTSICVGQVIVGSSVCACAALEVFYPEASPANERNQDDESPENRNHGNGHQDTLG